MEVSPCVLLIEDDYDIAEMLTFWFEAQGYTIEHADCGVTGLTIAQNLQPDLILLDIMLPDIDGFTVLQSLRETFSTFHITTVIVSAMSTAIDIKRGLELGADEYIVKPFDMNELTFRIEVAQARAAMLASTSKPMQLHDVFISYSRKDVSIMRKLCNDLRRAGFKVWVDEDDLELGTNAWERAISGAIRSAGSVIAIMTPDAEQSIWVGRELAMAEAIQKRIFPILVRGSEYDAIPMRLMSHQWVDARQNFQEAFNTLVASVKRYLNRQ